MWKWYKLSVFGQIKKIEIYAVPFYMESFTNLTKNNIRKSYNQYVRVINKDHRLWELEVVLSNLKIEERNIYRDITDFRAILIVHYSLFKKETYYVGSGGYGIVKKREVFEKSEKLLEIMYSFFPAVYW